MSGRSHRGPGLECIYKELPVVVHRGGDRLTLDGVQLATGVTRHC